MQRTAIIVKRSIKTRAFIDANVKNTLSLFYIFYPINLFAMALCRGLSAFEAGGLLLLISGVRMTIRPSLPSKNEAPTSVRV